MRNPPISQGRAIPCSIAVATASTSSASEGATSRSSKSPTSPSHTAPPPVPSGSSSSTKRDHWDSNATLSRALGPSVMARNSMACETGIRSSRSIIPGGPAWKRCHRRSRSPGSRSGRAAARSPSNSASPAGFRGAGKSSAAATRRSRSIAESMSATDHVGWLIGPPLAPRLPRRGCRCRRGPSARRRTATGARRPRAGGRTRPRRRSRRRRPPPRRPGPRPSPARR